MINSKTLLNPQKLPPTEQAAYYHSLQVHLQAILWMNLSIDVLDPKEWGWKINGSTFIPSNDRFGSSTREPA